MSAPIPAPLARDLRHWSSCARIWRLETAAGKATRPAATCGARLQDLEAQAAKSPRRSMDESAPTFFRLPDGTRDEARLLDPGLLLRAGADPETHRFIERFAEYLAFLGLTLETKEMRARACIVAPAAISTAIVRPFADTESHDDDVVVCCNLSDGPGRLALSGDDAPTPAPTPAPAAGSEGGATRQRSPDERSPDERAQQRAEEPSGSMSDSIALALEMGECLLALRRSILGYIPDEQGEPTLWFECLLRNKSSGARLP